MCVYSCGKIQLYSIYELINNNEVFDLFIILFFYINDVLNMKSNNKRKNGEPSVQSVTYHT